jgi:hypothetical protein
MDTPGGRFIGRVPVLGRRAIEILTTVIRETIRAFTQRQTVT